MNLSVDFELRNCSTCGIPYYVPAVYMEECRKHPKQYFYCPAGHARHFSESELDKIRRERDRLKQDTARLEDERRMAVVRAEKAEAEKRRIVKRAAAGVCPCCNRTFLNMQRHMKSKHPNVVAMKSA